MTRGKPRACSFYGQRTEASHMGETWIESEAFCYPRGGMTRRARVRFPDGKLRVVQCGLPDTFFSVPARVMLSKRRVAGFLSVKDGELRFQPTGLNAAIAGGGTYGDKTRQPEA